MAANFLFVTISQTLMSVPVTPARMEDSVWITSIATHVSVLEASLASTVKLVWLQILAGMAQPCFYLKFVLEVLRTISLSVTLNISEALLFIKGIG